MSVSTTALTAQRPSGVPTLPSAPRRLARSRRLAGGSSKASMGITPTVSSCPLR
jgi:hypothetical protein